MVLDNGGVHYFENGNSNQCNKKQRESFTIEGHKIQSITSGNDHGVMVTNRGAVFPFEYEFGSGNIVTKCLLQ